MNVTLELADLVEIYKRADLYDFMKGRSEKAEKKLNDANREMDDLRAVAEDVKERYTKLTDEATIQAAEFNQLRQRLIKTEQELAWWTATDTDESPEKKARDFIKQYDLAFADKEVKDACEIIRALLVQAHTKTPEVTA